VTRPTQASISLEALRHNYAVAKRHAPRSRVLAVVKANAYGHGVDRAARALNHADGFATVELDSAIRLRERGYSGTILLLEGFFDPSELADIAALGLAIVVHDENQLRALETQRPAKPLDVHFKINTGMNRLGFPIATARANLERLQKSGIARSITLMTHFATADGPEGIGEAMRRFDEATDGIALPRSLANSAAIFSHPASHADMVRLGIGLYGATPFADRTAESLGLRSAMTLSSRLIAVQDLMPGDRVGYGGEFSSIAPMRVGVVAGGYGDGYPRHAKSGTPILVGGVRTNVVGRISMDMLTVDLAPVPDANVGTPVVLWGDGLPIDEVAMFADTVGYELMCALAPRVAVVEQVRPSVGK
jgi:alanine racemase